MSAYSEHSVNSSWVTARRAFGALMGLSLLGLGVLSLRSSLLHLGIHHIMGQTFSAPIDGTQYAVSAVGVSAAGESLATMAKSVSVAKTWKARVWAFCNKGLFSPKTQIAAVFLMWGVSAFQAMKGLKDILNFPPFSRTFMQGISLLGKALSLVKFATVHILPGAMIINATASLTRALGVKEAYVRYQGWKALKLLNQKRLDELFPTHLKKENIKTKESYLERLRSLGVDMDKFFHLDMELAQESFVNNDEEDASSPRSIKVSVNPEIDSLLEKIERAKAQREAPINWKKISLRWTKFASKALWGVGVVLVSSIPVLGWSLVIAGAALLVGVKLKKIWDARHKTSSSLASVFSGSTASSNPSPQAREETVSESQGDSSLSENPNEAEMNSGRLGFNTSLVLEGAADDESRAPAENETAHLSTRAEAFQGCLSL